MTVWDKGHFEREPCYCLQAGPIVEQFTDIDYRGEPLVVERRQFLLAMRYTDDDERRKWWRLYDRATRSWISDNLGFTLDEARLAAEKLLEEHVNQ